MYIDEAIKAAEARRIEKWHEHQKVLLERERELKAREAAKTVIAELLDIYRGDIALFAKQVFDADLTEQQKAFAEEFRTERRIDYRAELASGKSFAVAIVIWWSLVCHDDVLVTVFGPSEAALKHGIWKQLFVLHDRMPATFKDLFETSAVRITRKADPKSCYAEMRLATSDNVRGIHATNNFVFVEDADGVAKDDLYTLHFVLADPNPKLCLINTVIPEWMKQYEPKKDDAKKADAQSVYANLVKLTEASGLKNADMIFIDPSSVQPSDLVRVEAEAKPDAVEPFDKDRYAVFDIEDLKRCQELTRSLPILIEPLETVTEAELFNEALSSLREMVRGEVRRDPVWLEAIRYQLENADYLSEKAARAD
jgi:hypothetical protein